MIRQRRRDRSPESDQVGRGIELATLAEELRAADIGLEFLTGESGWSRSACCVVCIDQQHRGEELRYGRGRATEAEEEPTVVNSKGDG